MKYLLVVLLLLSVAGCAVNPYTKAVVENLSTWRYWQDAGYYVQDIHSYENLAPYCIGSVEYIEVWVDIYNKNNPYENFKFKFFVRKNRPDNRCIPYNEDWGDFIHMIKLRLCYELVSEIENSKITFKEDK